MEWKSPGRFLSLGLRVARCYLRRIKVLYVFIVPLLWVFRLHQTRTVCIFNSCGGFLYWPRMLTDVRLRITHVQHSMCVYRTFGYGCYDCCCNWVLAVFVFGTSFAHLTFIVATISFVAVYNIFVLYILPIIRFDQACHTHTDASLTFFLSQSILFIPFIWKYDGIVSLIDWMMSF